MFILRRIYDTATKGFYSPSKNGIFCDDSSIAADRILKE